MGRLVKCQFCENKVDKDLAVRFEDKNYHTECFEQYKLKMEIYKYVAKVFKFKSETRPGPKIISQLNTFRNKGYTYQGILNSLIYHFEIQKGSIQKANEGIGIVPYVYEEAQEYFKNFTNKQKKTAEEIGKQLKKETQILYIRPKITEKKQKEYNLEELE